MNDTLQNPNISQQEIDEALAGVVYDSLRPVSIGLSLLYIFFAIAHSVLLPHSIAIPMVIVASVSAVFFGILVVLLERSTLSVHVAHQTATIVAQVVLFNSLLHFYLSGELHQSTNVLLLIVGVACFSLSTKCVTIVWLTALVGWGLILWSLPSSPEALHYIFAMFAATVLALLIFYVRLRIHQRLERLRLQEIQQKNELERALAAAQEVDRLKDDLISTVSHELRTPLTSLLGFTELMLQRDFPQSKQRELLTIIHSESLRLTNLINNFLDLQAMEAECSHYHFADVQIVPLLNDAVDVFSKADGKHTWQTTIPDNLPLVHADADRIRQVVTNLLANAVKFSTHGGTIAVDVRPQETQLTISIRDQGIGIPQEAIPKLFTKFFRVDDGATRTTNGTGLGLALIKEIVEAHQGRVWVESTEGKGSTFFFTLPLAR